jgi:hypothetical protein
METELDNDNKEKPLGGSRFLSGLQAVAQAAAVFVAVVYGTGFLIVAIHHAGYGIAQFDFLKTKIISTGIVFVLLTAISVVAAFRVFHVFGLRRTTSTVIPCKPENEAYLKIIIGLSFFVVAMAVSNIVLFFFEPFGGPKPWGLLCFLVIAALYVTLTIFERKYFDNHPALFMLGDLALMILCVGVFYRFYDHPQLVLVLWLYAVGIGAVIFSKLLQSGNVKHIEWEQYFGAITAVLLTYSTLIYPHIKPSFGGGVPSPVVLYLTGKNPIFPNTDSAEVLLLDETDHGYYVLLNAQEKTAYFLRRDLVSAIHFEKKDK